MSVAARTVDDVIARHRDNLARLLSARISTTERESVAAAFLERFAHDLVESKPAKDEGPAVADGDAPPSAPPIPAVAVLDLGKAILDSLADGIVVGDLAGNLLYWNPAALKLYGYSSLDEVRRPVQSYQSTFEFALPDGPPLPFDEWPLPRLMRGDSLRNVVYRTRRLDTGREWLIRYDAVSIPNPHDGSELFIISLHDLTEEHRAQAAMLRQASLVQAVASHTTDSVYVKDCEGRYLMFNAAAGSCVGKPADEVLGLTDGDIFDSSSAALVMASDRRVMESGRAETREEELSVGGQTRVYSTTKAPYRDAAGQTAGVVGISRDITERKEWEQLLRERDERLAEAMRIARMGNWYWEPTTGRVWWSDQTYELMGIDRSAVVPGYESFLSLVHEDDRLRVAKTLRGVMRDGGAIEFDARIVRPDGRLTWLHSRAEMIVDAQGQAVRLAGTDIDITERKMAEEALRERELFIRRLAEVTPSVIYLLDVETNECKYLNRSLHAVLGISDDAWRQADFIAQHMHPDDLARQAEHRRQVAALPDGMTLALEYRMRDSEGQWHWFLSRDAVYSRDPNGHAREIIGSATEITRLKRTKADLQQEKERLQLALAASGTGVWEQDLRTNTVYWSPDATTSWVRRRSRGRCNTSGACCIRTT